MSSRLLALATLLLLAPLAAAKPPELPVDTNVNCNCCEETPVDGLWFAVVNREEANTNYRDELLDLFLPVLRVRHLTPAQVKEGFKELSPRFQTAAEKSRSWLMNCFCQSDEPVGGMTLPSSHGMQHSPINAPIAYPLSRELEQLEKQYQSGLPVCPVAGANCHPDAEECEDESEEDEAEEVEKVEVENPARQQKGDAEDVPFEVKIEVTNPRTGEKFYLPQLTLVHGKTGTCFCKSGTTSVCVQIQIDKDGNAEATGSPTEWEILEIMPHQCKEGCYSEQEEAVPQKPEPLDMPRESKDDLESSPQAQHRFSVGRIIIVGNTHTPERVILEKMTFCPGMEIGPSYLDAAEHNLARLFGIMDSCESPVVRPVVEVIDLESPSTVKDVLVTVEETCASRATNFEEQEPATEEAPTAPPTCPPQSCPSCPSCPPCPAAPCYPDKGCTCPYLQKQQQEMMHCDPDEVFKESVLDNIDKLIKAQKAFKKAERLRREGDLDRASYWYAKVKEICPGSRYDMLATERLGEVSTQQSEESSPNECDNPDPVSPGEAEEQSSDVPQACCPVMGWLKSSCVAMPDHCKVRMEGLLKMTQGCCDCTGCLLIWKAHACVPMPKVDLSTGCHTEDGYETEDSDVQPPQEHGCKDVDAALFVAHLFGKRLKDEKAARFVARMFDTPKADEKTGLCACFGLYTVAHTFMPDDCWNQSNGFAFFGKLCKDLMPAKPQAEESEPAEECEPAPETEDPVTPEPGTQPYDVKIQPPLPPIDPKLVEALEQVLKASGDPTRVKLIIAPEESSGEAQELPDSPWPTTPPEVEFPSLFVDPDAELELESDEPAATSAPVNNDVGEILSQALDALKNNLYVDVTGNDEDQATLTFTIGGLECRVVLDGSGHKYFLIGLLPQTTGDIKAIQHSLNERVMRWIENMNSGGNQAEEPAENGANDDDGDDDSDDNAA